MAVLGSLSLISPVVSVDIKSTLKAMLGSEFRSCGKVKVAVLGSLSLISPVVSVDIKQH